MLSICRLYVPPLNVNLHHHNDCDEDLSFSLQCSEVTTQHMSPLVTLARPGVRHTWPLIGQVSGNPGLSLVWVRLQPHLDTSHSLSSRSVGRVGGSP